MERFGTTYLAKKPGCLSNEQARALRRALEDAETDPSLLSDLEGCGPIAILEKEFTQLCKTRYALALSSGTAALHAALLAAGIGPGDEAIVSPYSWPQSVSPVLFTGATPVFADIHADTFNLDPESVRNRVSPRTRVIVPVHLFGHIADMTALQETARQSGALVISDGAHSLGALLDGVPAGAWGDAACFSLGRGKLVSGGEGGILATDNRSLFERALTLTQHGDRVRRHLHPSKTPVTLSLNYRMHPLAALLALVDLRNVKKKIRHRRNVFDMFWTGLGATKDLQPQAVLEGEQPAPYGIPLTAGSALNRGELLSKMQKCGVPLRCGPVRMPLHLQIKNRGIPQVPEHWTHQPGACPVAEKRANHQELWLLSALDMDAVDADAVYEMGSIIRTHLDNPIADI